MLPDVGRQTILDALDRFDREIRDTPRWKNWESKKTQRYVIDHGGKHYPPKKILSIAVGFPVHKFTGGPETNGYLRERNFDIAEISRSDSPIRDLLEEILSEYRETTASQPFAMDTPIAQSFSELASHLAESEPVASRRDVAVDYSVGKGNWVRVPWVAFLDSRETTSTQRGVYPVILFRQDMTGFYLTFNQGVTDPKEEFGSKVGLQKLRERAMELRQFCASLHGRGFKLDHAIVLSDDPGLGRDYVDSTVAHKLYIVGEVPDDNRLLDDLELVLKAYDDYLAAQASESKKHADSEGTYRHFLFQANPQYYDLRASLKKLKTQTWLANQSWKQMRAGQTGFLWESGPNAGVLAKATILSDPSELTRVSEEREFTLKSDLFEGVRRRVTIRVDEVLNKPILRKDLLEHSELKDLSILKFANATNFMLTDAEYNALAELADTSDVVTDLSAICSSFATALRECHVTFGRKHDDLVRAFVSSLAAKPFAILTGLSGSGKTQIAMRFGEWLGSSRLLVIAVRPDWTGAEALFGYEDALKPPADGRPAWNVPAPLSFFLKAAADRSHPYVLVLDEMNLAHVERYFADVLSGMESGQGCLPNLVLGKDGFWRLREDAPERIPFPANVFIIGTVNVDETTYMFSPKVLDRANTFEFRVNTEDLSTTYTKPMQCVAGDRALVRGFLSLSQNSSLNEQSTFRHAQELDGMLREVHRILSGDGFEFGHRVYYESMRFAAMLSAAGNDDLRAALDRVVLQKLLPRLHGSRRRLELLIRKLSHFCWSLGEDRHLGTQFDPDTPGDGTPDLSESFDKLHRMYSRLRANQFTSFTEQ